MMSKSNNANARAALRSAAVDDTVWTRVFLS